MDNQLAVDQNDPASSDDCASSVSAVALYFAIPGGRASPTDFATAVATVLVMPVVMDHVDPASPVDSASSDSTVALYFEIPPS